VTKPDLNIENEHTFRAALGSGINLFLGAGFSVLAEDEQGRRLPVGTELVVELAEYFGVANSSRYDLPRLSTVISSTRREEFNSYLRRRFTTGRYDPRYQALDSISVNSIFTTNIDDLIHKIYGNSRRHYLNDLDLSGPSFRDRLAVDFVAFHGSVVNLTRPFRFSTLDIAGAYSARQDRWHYLKNRLESKPTLFWGYGFNDWGTLQTLYEESSGLAHHSDKWIQLRDPLQEDIDFFRALGFQIIESGTSELLDYLGNIHADAAPKPSPLVAPTKELFPDDFIPDPGTVPVRATLEFYLGSPPTWGDIYSGQVHRTAHYNTVRNVVNSNRNAIVVGIPACGKTTLLMQVAAGTEFDGHKLFLDSLSAEKSVLIEKRLEGGRALVFLDNLADSLAGVGHLFNVPNIRVVAAERDYNFEIVAHRLDLRRSAAPIDITEVSDADIQSCLDFIPTELTLPKGRRVGNLRSQQLSLFELIESRLKYPTLRERFRTVLEELGRTDERLRRLLVMISYVNYCRTPVSMDMIVSFLRDDYSSIQELYSLLRKLGQMISEYTGTRVLDDQDYYVPRSLIVGEAVLHTCPSDVLRDVIFRFHRNVSPYRIVDYSTFRRSAYDNGLMMRAFRSLNDGVSFYSEVLDSDPSPYTFQHAALYASKKGDYTRAFEWIDRALTLSGGQIWSIRNSYAVILFNANFAHFGDPVGRKALRDSMDILKECYRADRRKPYHAATFAKQSLRLWDAYQTEEAHEYLDLALSWLQEERQKAPWNWEVKNLLPAVRTALDGRSSARVPEGDPR
jgi:tetratricopeptide (TPR) repeat protein